MFPEQINYKGSIYIPKSNVQFYRKPHDIEIKSYDLPNWDYGGDGYRLGKPRSVVIRTGKGMPEVYRAQPGDLRSEIPCEWIKLWRALNPDLDDRRFSSLLGNATAWTNNTGWPGRYNCITGEDEGGEEPAFHAPIINGGATLKGIEKDGWLEIEGLLTTNHAPSVDYVLSRPWLWYYGTTVLPTGQVNLITRLGIDGSYYPVRVPILTELPIRMKLSWLHKLPPGYLPADARWMPTAGFTENSH